MLHGNTSGAIPELLGFTRTGKPIYAISGADDGPAGGAGAGAAGSESGAASGGAAGGEGAKGGEGSGDLGDAGKRALDSERNARTAAEKRAAAAEAKVKEFEDAKKTETERLNSNLADAERERTSLRQELQDARADRAIERAAAKAGFIDPEDAVLAISRASLKLEDDGTPTSDSLERALKALGEAKPHLVGAANGRGSWDGGPRKTSGAGPNMNDMIVQAARGQ